MPQRNDSLTCPANLAYARKYGWQLLIKGAAVIFVLWAACAAIGGR